MTRRIVIAIALLAAVVGAVVVVVVRPPFLFPRPSNTLVVAGDVQDDIVDIVAPAIQRPVPDFTVGIPSTSTAAPAGRSGPPAGSSSRQPTISGEVVRVYVSQGGTVLKGQKVVQLDTTLLTLGVAQARTAAAKQRADYRKTGDALATIDSAFSKLSTARSKLVNLRSTLITTRSTLLTTRAKLLKGRAQLVTQIKLLEKLLAHMPPIPPGPPPPGPPQPSPKAILAQLKSALAKLDTGLSKLDAGLAKLDTGLAKMSTGFAQLATARAQLVTAKQQVENARKLLKILADSSHLSVDLARVKRNAATVRSPVSGLVTFATHPGTVAMTGAPLVSVRRAGPVRVTTYLTSDQLASVHVGSPVVVGADSLGNLLLHGRVTVIGSSSTFPPTSFPTQIVHMTRATKVTITLDPGQRAPYGTPVDVTIQI